MTLAVVGAAALVGAAAVGPAGGLALAVLAGIGLRSRRGPVLLALVPAALLALSAAYIVVQQVRHGLHPGFSWPLRFSRVHGVAYTGLLALPLALLVDRLRRPSDPDRP